MKIVKKIILIIILILLVLVDVWILDDFGRKIVKSGIIDKDENPVTGFKYATIDAVSFFEGYKYTRAFKDNIFNDITMIVYVDTNGNEYPISKRDDNFQEIRPNYVEDIAIVADGELNKGGYIDADGNFLTEIKYDHCDDFEDGFAKVGIDVEDDTKYGIIDRTGKEIIPCMYDKIDTNFSDSYIFYVTLGKEYSILDNNGKTIAKYDEDGNVEFDKSLGELNKLGKLDSDNISFTKSIIIIKNNDKYAFYSKEGKKLIDYIFDSVEDISSEDLFLVTEEGKRIITDSTNNFSFDCSLIEKDGITIDGVENGRLRIIKDDKMGIVDFNGNIIIEPKYDNVSIQTARKNYFCVQDGESHGVYDLDGKEIIPCSSKYKAPLVGNGDYFITAIINTKLLAMWIVYLIITFILEIIVLILIFKRKKEE